MCNAQFTQAGQSLDNLIIPPPPACLAWDLWLVAGGWACVCPPCILRLRLITDTPVVCVCVCACV